MDCAQFVLVGALHPIVAHGDEGDLIGRTREKGADGRLCRDQRGRVKPIGPARRDNTLRPGAGPLDDSLAAKIDRRSEVNRSNPLSYGRN
jgi:hypothetical protein